MQLLMMMRMTKLMVMLNLICLDLSCDPALVPLACKQYSETRATLHDTGWLIGTLRVAYSDPQIA